MVHIKLNNCVGSMNQSESLVLYELLLLLEKKNIIAMYKETLKQKNYRPKSKDHW